jgi:hypothetical protein
MENIEMGKNFSTSILCFILPVVIPQMPNINSSVSWGMDDGSVGGCGTTGGVTLPVEYKYSITFWCVGVMLIPLRLSQQPNTISLIDGAFVTV